MSCFTSTPLAALVGCRPNDKERIVVAIIIANFVPFTLARLAACMPVVALMDAISERTNIQSLNVIIHMLSLCQLTKTAFK